MRYDTIAHVRSLLLTLLLPLVMDCSAMDITSYVKQICKGIPIHTTAPKTQGDNGFRITIDGLPSPDKYRPGETYTVLVNGTEPLQKLMGVMIRVTAKDKKGNNYVPGSFNTSVDGQVQDLLNEGTCDTSVISHRYLFRKDKIKFLWKAPTQGAGCIHFNASVIEHSDVWYKDQGQLHKVICEESTQRDSASAHGSSVPEQNDQDECCACGHAMYTVEFKGMWSRQTHPKGFPDEKNSFQLHWSSLVGASHSKDYRIWDYGQHASRGVKEVCEYGSSRSVENEMKANSEKIRTVIKTKQLWGPEKILESLKAVYTVNKKKHFLSLLTMVGPSPDWCLGVSAQSMCMSNCTWRDNLEIDLYPWDAGTDSRVTYLGRKMPTRPPDHIQRITSTYPNDRESPFYGQDIKPFARLTLKKSKEACTDDDGRSNSAENFPSTDELVSMMKKKMMMNKKMEMEKCATSQWSDWADCSNPCGSGLRERRRMLKTPDITAAMCGLELVESETCVGDCTETRRNKLSDNFIMRHEEERDPDDVCAVTAWSDWSPCSATCGLGMKERWRMFLHNSEKRVDCGIHLMEKDLCRGEFFDCRKAMMMKNFTAICRLPASVGPCRGDFPRWHYNSTMQKCQMFGYGGCRGNENRFETEKECVDLCAEHMADLMRKSHMLQKQQMMKKQMMMEKQLLMEKQRMMEKQLMMEKQATMEEDMRRKQLLMEKQRMMAKQGDTTMSNEEKKAFMMKKQMMEHAASQDASDDDQTQNDAMKAKMMRKQKRLMKKKQRMERRKRKKMRQRKMRMQKGNGRRDQKQSDGPGVDCMVTPWSNWSPCSVTCGRGLTMKTRMIKVQPQNGGRRCPRRLIKKKKCRQKKCPINCKVAEWGEWTACSKTCGDNSVQIRRRELIQRPKRGGLACPAKREKKYCKVPMCPDSHIEENMRRFMMFHRRY